MVAPRGAIATDTSHVVRDARKCFAGVSYLMSRVTGVPGRPGASILPLPRHPHGRAGAALPPRSSPVFTSNVSVGSHILNFVIIAWILFMLIKAANKMRKQQPATPPAPSTTEMLLTEIRDVLIAKR